MKKILMSFLMLLLAVFSTVASAQEDVCWKPSYGRGVGVVPENCPAGRERIGLLCYSQCPPGMKRAGFDCHSVCPDGMRDDGLFCRAAEYGRGAGYAWQIGDHGIVWDDAWWHGMTARCERDHGRGNCERGAGIVYPKCKPGYEAVGCCICRPKVPNCQALGMNPGVDLSCAKKIIIGDPEPGTCRAGMEYQAGLCYGNCNAGFYGVGPVCWGQCPKDRPVDCGAMCGKTADACAQAITQQVVGVLQVVADVALTVATAGAGAGATAGSKAAQAAAKSGKAIVGNAAKQTVKGLTKSQIRTQILKMAKETGKSIAENQLEQMVNAAAGEDFDFTSLDPTGIASMIKNFVLPMCSVNTPQPTATAAPAPAAAPAKGPAAGAPRLVKADDPTVYLVDPRGAKRPIANPDVFNGCGLDWGAIQTRPRAEVNALPTGAALASPAACLGARLLGSAIKTADNPTVYLVAGDGSKLPIASPPVFTGCGLDWGAIQTLPPFTVNALPTGKMLQRGDECAAVRKAAMSLDAAGAPTPPQAGPAPGPQPAANGPASYGRGAGYVVWDEAKCRRENKQGCEKDGAIFYPRCQPGYKGVGPVCWKQ